MKRTALGGIALQGVKQLLNVTWRIGDHTYPPAVLAESLVDLPKFPTNVGGQCDFHGAHEAQTDALTCCACVLKICAIGAFAEDIFTTAVPVHDVKQAPAGWPPRSCKGTFLITSSLKI